MELYREEFDQICRSGTISGPVEFAEIKKAESELRVEFPSEYREILNKYGAVLANNLEIYGILKAKDNDPPQWIDLVSETKKLRRMGQAGTERPGFIPIGDDGTGIHFYLDTSLSPETKIFAIGPGIDRPIEGGLFKFLLDISKGKIEL